MKAPETMSKEENQIKFPPVTKGEADVAEKITQEAWNLILEYTESASIDDQKMTDFAYLLGQSIGGGHRQRKGEGVPGMRAILVDWLTRGNLTNLDTIQALDVLIDIFEGRAVPLKPLAKELNKIKYDKEDFLTPRIEPCCMRLRAVKLSSAAVKDAPDNFDTLCGLIAASSASEEKPFYEAKSTFLEENYPNRASGLHVHPDMYIHEKDSLKFADSNEETDERPNEAKLLDSLTNQFQGDDCFIFQNFNLTGIDKRVAEDFCNQLKRNLEKGSTKVEEVEEQMKKISGLTFLDWDSIKRDAKKRSKFKGGSISACTIEVFKNHLKSKTSSNSFLVVNLSLATIIFINMDPKGEEEDAYPSQMQLVKRYLEELLVPNKEIEWRLIGFEISPDDPDSPRCNQCKKHVLDIKAFNQDFRTTITALYQEEDVNTVSNKGRIKKIKRHYSPAEKNTESYVDLISNIVVLANLDLTPHSSAVGKVMKQLCGTTKQVVGPAEYAANEDFIHNKIFWNKEQRQLLSSPERKVVLQADFGCGKSFMLHRMIQRYSEAGDYDNFLISFLPQQRPFVRGVLDVANRMKYMGAASQGQVQVISVADIVASMSSLDFQKDVSQETLTDKCFLFLQDLTKKHPHANIVVDEVRLENLVNKKEIHDNDFVGSLWMAVSSISKYDFRDQIDQTDLSQIPAVTSQKFKLKYLKNNMRNGCKVISGSLSLQDGSIEKGTIGIFEKNNTDVSASASAAEVVQELSRPKARVTSASRPTNFNRMSSLLSATFRGRPWFSKSSSRDDAVAAEPNNDDGIVVRMIEGGRSGVFVGPKEGAKGCPTVLGMDPRQLKSEKAALFLSGELPERLRKEAFVILGNTERDIDWLLQQMADGDKVWLTVYNPRDKSEIVHHEKALEKYLQNESGGLVTLGSLFNGMESARVVFVYENPYASHFRANYMRASVELILIDRHISGTQLLSLGRYLNIKMGGGCLSVSKEGIKKNKPGNKNCPQVILR